MNLVLFYSVATILFADVAFSTQILLPLYTYPTDPMWSTLLASLGTYTQANFLIIINPNSGPGQGTQNNSDYIKGITKLKSHGNAEVIAYVHTSYGKRNITVVQSEVSTYASWPAQIRPVGIFFDEAASSQSSVLILSKHYSLCSLHTFISCYGSSQRRNCTFYQGLF